MGGVFSSSNVDERIQHAFHVRDLEREIVALKVDNNQLRAELTRQTRRRARDVPTTRSEVSVLKVDEFVEQMLANPHTNLAFVPDFAERPMQRQALLFLLQSMATGLDTFKAEFLGHELTMQMHPIIPPPQDATRSDGALDDEEAYSDYRDDDYEDGSSEAGVEVKAEYDASAIPM